MAKVFNLTGDVSLEDVNFSATAAQQARTIWGRSTMAVAS